MLRGAVLALAIPAVFAAAAETRKWTAPDADKARVNPVEATPAALLKGRALYQKHCASCHGDKGKGDGPAARLHAERSKRAPQDLTDAKVQAGMTDGEIFWKLGSGFKEDAQIIMPSFTEEIPKDEDRWKLVHYVRTLGAQK